MHQWCKHNNAKHYLQAPTVSVDGNPVNAAVNATNIYSHTHICTIHTLPSMIVCTRIKCIATATATTCINMVLPSESTKTRSADVTNAYLLWLHNLCNRNMALYNCLHCQTACCVWHWQPVIQHRHHCWSLMPLCLILFLCHMQCMVAHLLYTSSVPFHNIIQPLFCVDVLLCSSSP